jgi:hypothetical protein
MVTRLQQSTPHKIKLEFADEPVTAFGGLVLIERLAAHLGLWRTLEGMLPARRGHYEWGELIKALVAGLLSGGTGTWAAEEVRQDTPLLGLLSLEGAAEEATVWRALRPLACWLDQLQQIQAIWTRRMLSRARLQSLLVEGFVPLFGDGTLLEGSRRREGTKYIEDKGWGLLWATLWVGPLLAAQRLAPAGEGEITSVRELLRSVRRQILKPLRLARRALALLDGLHANEGTLSLLEGEQLHYVVGANGLAATAQTLGEQPEDVWEQSGAHSTRGWAESAVCVCWLQCTDWPHKRLLVGRRWRDEHEFLWNYAGVLTDLRARDVAHVMEGRGLSFARAIWHLYDLKGGLETQFKDALSDLDLHHPPCQEHARNAAFYGIGALAHTLGVGLELLGRPAQEARTKAAGQSDARKTRPPRRMRLWRVRRTLLAVPARVSRHARELVVRVLGLSERRRQQLEGYFGALARC